MTRRPRRTTTLPTSKVRPTPAERAITAVKALHNNVRVGAYDITISLMSGRAAATNEALGLFTAGLQVIHLDAKMASPVMVADTLLHEIGHAIFWVFGIGRDDSEERIVRTLATSWAQVYRDNPWLLAWLAAALA